MQLQQALDLEKRSKVRWRTEGDGHQGQVPLCRADLPGQREQVRERRVKKELVLEVQDDIKIFQNFLAVIDPHWCWEIGWRSSPQS